MNPTIKVAKQFPNTDFEHATGYKTDKNVGIYNARFYEGRYLAGIVAKALGKDIKGQTQEVLADLYEWATVVRLEPTRRVA